jgi:hypothetical protein
MKKQKVELAKSEFEEKIEKEISKSIKLIISFISFCHLDPGSVSVYVFQDCVEDALRELIKSGRYNIKQRHLYVIALACIIGYLRFAENELADKTTLEIMKAETDRMLKRTAEWMAWQEHPKPPHSPRARLRKSGVKIKRSKKQKEKERKKRKERIEKREKSIQNNEKRLTQFFHFENPATK